MKKMFLIAACVAVSANVWAQKITVGSKTVMGREDFGLTTNKRSWNGDMKVKKLGRKRKVVEDYDMLTGKRRHCHNEGTEQTYVLVNSQKDRLLLVVRKYKDGTAFRYILPQALPGEKITSEQTRLHIPDGANRWLMDYDGPGYEGFYDDPAKNERKAGQKRRFGVPALFEVEEGQFMLFTEGDVLRGQSGSILNGGPEEYSVELFSEYDCKGHPMTNADASHSKNGTSNTGLCTPWRIAICGELSDIVASTLVTDVATPSVLSDASWIEPGVSSWIYWANNHGSQEYQILKDYVDLAAEMHWPYTLVDAEWDVMRGGDIRQLVNYSVKRGVKPMIWYNSTTNWTGEWAPTPQGRLNDAEERDKEFRRIASWGVKGVKIDFFRDDTEETMNYYIDLMESAAKHRLLVNFHGGTIPRGWQRTYPNFISAESVYGAEWYNNRPTLTNKAARHNATLPFTRNVIGPMDYTPGTFTDSQHPHITTHAHELALTMLFESGIQHMPDRPTAYTSLPDEVKSLLMSLPTVWDETRLLSGYPGDHAVLARRCGEAWYIAGINGTDEAKTLTISLPAAADNALVITDGATQTEFCIERRGVGSEITINCKPRGGFVIKL